METTMDGNETTLPRKADRAAHTPGPWTVETLPTSSGHCHKIDPIRACLYVDHRGAGWSDEVTTRALADARLIAAAPDLLAACQAAYATHNLTESEPGLPTLTQVGQLLKAALAKVEG